LSHDGKIVASSDCVWDGTTGKVLDRIRGQNCSIQAIAISPDRRVVALATSDAIPERGRRIRLWDWTTSKEIKHFGDRPVHSACYSPDGKTLAAGNGDGSVSFWDVATGRESRNVRGHEREINSITYSPDGKLLASCSFDGDIYLWDVASGKPLRHPSQEAGRTPYSVNVLAVAFSPNGKMLDSAEQSFTSTGGECFTLWEVATGRVRLRMAGHLGYVNSVAFSGDGRTLVTGGTDTTALVWDLAALPDAPARPSRLSERELEKLWDDMLAPDAAKGYRAIRFLSVSGDAALFLRKHLLPASSVDSRWIAQLIKDLDSDRFAEREKAAAELQKLGELVEPALRQALEKKPSVEVRRRLSELLDRLSAEWLRTQRAVEALELMGTPEAQKVLKKLAQGAPEARLTQEAKAALQRLAK